ncbi:4-(cytidine 5'-diphospho)-2-C-methyl-D-erythritol kinase [Thiohalobacter sp. IOR34]|uniref:4-(cytidine 5'-diphospho)-2-C-methyl-D-erythritol kinase n=1 Tax=Thiohalobacter sp. IOR34 TaxID=3057176 RepID=UPI0025AF0818|nr:4-(cytidine 5'-diphospho)-2-C-methyl-D-erythritol kinase [Thiohalobacter sp. IOR34]WJW75948.1 4-(cytidine 5'-diphospho)-2-C-methyl-D-erythritol kinase [Thiohalobacter sp. IOR34]
MSLPQRWPAPAKLNLFLHVTGRRPDGYHELQTLFQFLDFGDELRFRLRPDGQVLRSAALAGVSAEADLCLRAARRLQALAGVKAGVEITLDKRLPMGGGLGGGSSDAATVLLALNRLWGCDLTLDELARLGLELGADVPVFVRGRAAWAEGVGERLEPVELPEPWYLVLVPSVSVSTAGVFSAPELTRDSRRITIADFLSGAGRNDCEPVVRARYPEVARLLDWLGQRGEARLTGTGGCVFAAFDSREAAEGVKAELPPAWSGFVARGCNRSPLYRALEEA